MLFRSGCTAAIGLACGGDGPSPDATVDANKTPDAFVPPDAKVDATPTPDSGPDAPPVVTADGGADAGCVNKDGCTSNGQILCNAQGNAVTCGPQAADPKCFEIKTTQTCLQGAQGYQVCKAGMGCVCDEDDACGVDGNGMNGAGTYCDPVPVPNPNTSPGQPATLDGIYECVAHDATGCVFRATEEADQTPLTRTCEYPLQCGGDPGEADCECPTSDGSILPGAACTVEQHNQRKCDMESTSVVVCQQIDANDKNDDGSADEVVSCYIWDNGVLIPDDPNNPDDNAGDNCKADGLTCPFMGNAQCICPSNEGNTDYYTNANSYTKARRELPGDRKSVV